MENNKVTPPATVLPVQDQPFDLAGMPGKNEMLGNCRIIDMLGQGSMGVVYRAFDVELEMERAIKVLRPGKSDIVRRKFEAEAKITARLDHPNIVRVQGSGIWHELPFIQMELIRGVSVRDVLAAQPRFHPPVCLAVSSQVAAALDYAHHQNFSIWGNTAQELVHCDLKPENLLVVKDSGIVKVTDFGLAHFVQQHGATGWGTPAYMSPEQHAQAPVSCRSDIYAIGVLLYEMVCGVRPFPDDEMQMAGMKKDGTYRPVSAHHSSVPASLVSIIERCLQPDPGKRFGNHESLRYAIDNALAEITPRSAQEVVRSFFTAPDRFVPVLQTGVRHTAGFRSRRAVLMTAGIVLGAIIAGGVAYYRVAGRSQDGDGVSVQAADAREPAPNRRGEGETADVAVSTVTPHVMPQRSPGVQANRPVVPKPPAGRDDAAGLPPVLKTAATAFASGDYTRVISEVHGLEINGLAVAAKDSAVVMLAEAYYMTRSIREAVALADRYDINDARYQLTMALSFEVSGNLVRAADHFDRAIMAPMKFARMPRERLLSDRAEFYARYYQTTRTELVRTLMIDAYRLFLREGCRSASPRCDSARAIVGAHE